MGSPEIPETNENGLMPTHIYPDMPPPSDESDSELTAGGDNASYNGYQRLPTDDNQPEVATSEGFISNEMETRNTEDESLTTVATDNLPHILSAEAEIEQELWRQPRPNELQINLDNTNTQLILRAMASFSLPNAVVPDWAANVPEECWKEDLLQRIRARESTLSVNKQS